jgi:hypothetical protein
VDWARQQGLTIASLNTLGPSLEEVFVQITGLTLPARAEGEGQRSNSSRKGKMQ